MEHSGRGPEDMLAQHAIRFGLRGSNDIIDCLISWDAIDALEGSEPAINRADRLARFERHRPTIEAAALAKCRVASREADTIRIDTGDIARLDGPIPSDR